MITIQDLKSHRIGILGFGQEGQAVLKYLNTHGLTATIYDEKNQTDWSETQKSLAEQAQAFAITGADYLNKISEATIVFRSPGIWRKHEQILAAESQGTIITSQAKWFFEHTANKIIGVTGTKGKGTTCSLITEVLKAAGKHVYLTGNIGKIQPLEFLDSLTAEDYIVYELSSFQLQDLGHSPNIGVCLMTTSDHLNHHSNLDEYHEAKGAISAFQTSTDITIYNADYQATVAIGQKGNGQKYTVSKLIEPSRGAFISGEKIILNNIFPGQQTVEIDCSNRKLRGRHNLENLAAAAMATALLNIETNTIKEAINTFAGLEHRLQFVGLSNGVAYYNDSISTVPETTLAALSSFIEPVHLLLGGSDKGLAYDEMVDKIIADNNSGITKIASITFLGEIGKGLKNLFEEKHTAIPLQGPYTDFRQAIAEIKSIAKPGDVVLLSPASASFDMFQNYAERGRKFVELVS